MSNKQNPRLFKDLSRDRSFVLSVVVIVIILIITTVVIEQLGGSAKLAELVARAGAWAPAVFILVKALTYVIAPLSGGPVKVIAGTLFGFVPGVIFSTLGDLLGASINFWIARIFGREAVHKYLSKKSVKKVDDFVAHVETWKTLLAARIILSSFYDFISYTAGLSKIRYKTFFWVTLIGGIPGSALAVGLGATLLENMKLFIGLLLGCIALFALSYFISRAAEKNSDQ